MGLNGARPSKAFIALSVLKMLFLTSYSKKALSSFSFFTFIRRLISETTERTFVEICVRMRYKNLTYSRRAHPLSQPLSM